MPAVPKTDADAAVPFRGPAPQRPAALAVGVGSARARAPRVERRPVHGVLLVDKPVGWTSQDVLSKAKRLLRAEKAGHTGTLDPLASGLLPLCFGAATKFSQVSLDADKSYRATVRLGQTRAGGDREGEILQERPVSFDRQALNAALARLTGPIQQIPPMHSALKHQGRALYTYARAGQTVERAARHVTIWALQLVDWSKDQLVLDVRCSKGTYIRTLAEDLGEALGCGAHLAALSRTACGGMPIEAALTPAQLEALDEASRLARLLPVDVLLDDWPLHRLSADEAGRFLTGLRRRVAAPDADRVRVYGPQSGAFLGSAHIQAGELIPDRLLSPPEVAAITVAASCLDTTPAVTFSRSSAPQEPMATPAINA
jgi:tRNA pseudouridine55 synthase